MVNILSKFLYFTDNFNNRVCDILCIFNHYCRTAARRRYLRIIIIFFLVLCSGSLIIFYDNTIIFNTEMKCRIFNFVCNALYNS